ncbi:MAG: InlB B-repeat-containing protein [Methanobacteriaceae archaeon]|nr:InlB B-repeat-containing protein [Candidatus Methanorudis spinitermitis]
MKIKKFFVVMALAIVVFSMILATTYATNEVKYEKKDSGLTIESKQKVASYKVTWNANGGKIGTKKTVTTSVKKGSKIGKPPTTPKRTGYTFKGWYNKKNGGTKISTNTKPTKSVTAYAQWNKGDSKVLTAEEKKLVGTWWRNNPYTTYKMDTYGFRADGTFSFVYNTLYIRSGNWKASGGKITFTNVITSREQYDVGKYSKIVAEYQFEKRSDGKGDYLKIASLSYTDRNNLPFSFSWDRWYKS